MVYKEEARDRLCDPLATILPPEKVPSPVQAILPDEYKSDKHEKLHFSFQIREILPKVQPYRLIICLYDASLCFFHVSLSHSRVLSLSFYPEPQRVTGKGCLIFLRFNEY